LSDSIFSQKNIQKNKLRRRNSKKQLKIFEFGDKIPAFSARLSVLITFFSKFLITILFLVVRQNIESKKHRNTVEYKRKIEEIIFAMFSEFSEISCSFVQHQAVIIFKNSKHNNSSTLTIFLLNYCRKAIPNVILTGFFPYSDFFTFLVKNCHLQEKSTGVKRCPNYKIFYI
jgi:hypothetical protein